MDPNRPITTDLRHLSLTANNITAKLTNQFTQTVLSTFDWQQPIWLRWWLPLTLSKRQSPLLTTVLLRTTLTRTIKLHYYMLPPGSNHLLYFSLPYTHVTYLITWPGSDRFQNGRRLSVKKNLWKIWFCTIYRVFAHLGFFSLRGMHWDQKKGGRFGVSYPLI